MSADLREQSTNVHVRPSASIPVVTRFVTHRAQDRPL